MPSTKELFCICSAHCTPLVNSRSQAHNNKPCRTLCRQGLGINPFLTVFAVWFRQLVAAMFQQCKSDGLCPQSLPVRWRHGSTPHRVQLWSLQSGCYADHLTAQGETAPNRPLQQIVIKQPCRKLHLFFLRSCRNGDTNATGESVTVGNARPLPRQLTVSS